MRGTLEERSPGHWRLRVYVGRDPVNGHPRQVSRTIRGGKRQAQRALTELLHEVGEGNHKGTSATFGALLDEWLAHQRRQGRATTTLETYDAHIRKHLKPALGSIRLAQLSAHDLDTHYGRLAAAGLAPATIRLQAAVVSGALTQAVRWGWVARSVASLARPPGKTKAQEAIPDAETVRRLVEAALAEDPDMGMALILAALTGARRGELCGLRWSDLDTTAATLSIRRAWVPVAGGHELTTPKSGKARTVAIGRDGLEVLGRYRDAHAARAKATRLTLASDPWLLSYDCGHTPLSPKAFSAYVVELGRRIGITVHLHQLRHFSATQLVAGGIDVRTVAERLGHQDGGALALRVYTHALPQRDQAAAEVIGLVLSSKGAADAVGRLLVEPPS